MDGLGHVWYYSCMNQFSTIPVFDLFGETSGFPDVVHCEYFLDRAGLHDWTISPHRHDSMVQVFVMERGRATVTVDDREVLLESGNFLFIPTHVVHGFVFAKGAEGLVISIPVAAATGRSAREGVVAAALSRPVCAPVSQGVMTTARLLADSFASRGTFRAEILGSLAQALLMQIAESAPNNDASGTDPRLARLDVLIAEHMAEGWSASDYAAALSVTVGHLSRLCRSVTGAGAAAYIEETVITEACRLLAFTRLSVSEVGYRLGYSDPSYFSRRFRVRRSVAPHEYRARFLSGA